MVTCFYFYRFTFVQSNSKQSVALVLQLYGCFGATEEAVSPLCLHSAKPVAVVISILECFPMFLRSTDEIMMCMDRFFFYLSPLYLTEFVERLMSV